jgi:hypothetical protein
MSQIQQSVDVDVPVSVAYNQWTQLESFPHFMSGVESITQVDDTRNHWVTSIAGVERSSILRSPSSTPTNGSPGAALVAMPSMPAWSPSTASATPPPG